MRRIQITHNTRYEYAETVTFNTHKLHIRPREGHDVRIESSELSISPTYQIRWERDIYSNSLAMVDFLDKSAVLDITSNVVVQHYGAQPLEFGMDETAQSYPFHYNPMEQVDLIPYQMAVFPRDYLVVQKWLEKIYKPGKLINTVSLLETLNKTIVADFKYTVREEPGVQSPQQTMNIGSGSCRDLAALFIEACRVLGLASRFVSGYLLQPSENNTDQHGSTHAWSEVYLPGSGWWGFDSTSGLLVSEDHIAVAHHRHPEAIPPVSGAYLGSPNAQSSMSVCVDVKML
ncbi:MAG: transglutaminase family protein [Gammaproteobacteria bacterium]|nr:transglutaminase family protein [Gammaproteobacteria bacterium]